MLNTTTTLTATEIAKSEEAQRVTEIWKSTFRSGPVWVFLEYKRELAVFAEWLDTQVWLGNISKEELEIFLEKKMIPGNRSRLTWRTHLERVDFELN